MSREMLVDSMDADVAWRRQELSALRTGVARANGPAVETAARTAVALAYAHWEGYVITASRLLLEYVDGLRLSYSDLADSYLAICLAGKLAKAEASVRRIQMHVDVVTEMRRSEDQAIFPSVEKMIHAEGNLKSEKFRDILTRLSLDSSAFELHYNWLDAELLRRRNNIAHGGGGFADADFAMNALSVVGDLLDAFRTAVQNAAVLEVFRRASSPEELAP